MESLISKIQAIGTKTLADISAASDLATLEGFRVSVLGKKGSLSEVLKGLGSVSAEERPKIGAAANEVKAKIEGALESKREGLEAKDLEQKLASERLDVSIPARKLHRGSLHPITQTTRRMVEVLSRLGFDLLTGPEIETDYFCFEAVNIPADHPARDQQDTFFMGPGLVLRTQTTAIQTRAMRGKKWPIRILCPGAVYRKDNDATHSPMFHQLEGLWIDKGVKMSDLKGTLEFFAKEMFGSATRVRLRPSYFSFVEPGAEIDVSCFKCDGKDPSCKICKGTGWMEILGAGMVHPKLLELAGYDPKEVSGFAFGMGIDRIAMMAHDVPDLRLLFEGDQRFNSQF
ncbi:MAG: phenylalanine--tRNA ligase subunit alpha [Bdellovibrionales bacterium]|nr:phenylalanine--tRNA ligase subunit alpha [Bdellovibrionales bacterium]